MLRLLDSPLVQVPSSTAEVLKRCIQAEEASIDVQGVRERVVRIGRVGSMVADEQGADVCVRWLIGETCLLGGAFSNLDQQRSSKLTYVPSGHPLPQPFLP